MADGTGFPGTGYNGTANGMLTGPPRPICAMLLVGWRAKLIWISPQQPSHDTARHRIAVDTSGCSFTIASQFTQRIICTPRFTAQRCGCSSR